MNFGQALDVLRAGGKVTRSGWNGPGQWVALSPGFALEKDQIFSKPVKDHVGSGLGRFAPYLMLLNVQGIFVPWLASQGDILAEDWVTA